MAKLGDFRFEISEASYESLRRSFSFEFHKNDRIGHHPSWQNVGLWSEEITVEGQLLVKGLRSLDPLIEMAKRKKPIIFVAGHGEIFGKMIILNIDTDQSFFLQDGSFLKQEFTIKMARFYDE